MKAINAAQLRSGLALAGLLVALAPAICSPATTANPSATFEQCVNGTLAAHADCTGAAWIAGNTSGSTTYWYEGDSVPFRVLFTSLVVSTQYAYATEWSTTASGRHAYDYLTRFDRTESTANPCSGVSGCSLAGFTTFSIPTDPAVAGSITQLPGEFVMYGATVNSVSAYTLTGSYASNSSTHVTVTFTPSVANPVLAFSAHLASRGDWGSNSSAISLSGSPFHAIADTLNGASLTQDRALASAAVHGPHLTVTVAVVNPGGASFVPSDFTLQVTATDVTPASFPGAPDPGTVVQLAPGAYSVKLVNQGYGATYSPECIGSIAARDTVTCSVVIDSDEIFLDKFDGA